MNFAKQTRAKIVKENPNFTFGEVGKELGAQWGKLSQAPQTLANCAVELELELIQTQMTQKPMLRAEVYARALRASQNRKEDSL